MSVSPDSTIIRASSLPQFPDCPRRFAARSFSDDVKAAGFTLSKNRTSIGAVIGTGTHEGLAHAFRKRMEGSEASRESITQHAVEAIDAAISDGVVWDDTTTNPATAHKQAIRQAVAVLQVMGHRINPVAVEEAMEAGLGDGFRLSGHLDIREADAIVDFKTGTVQRANQSQYGAYSLLAEANGHRVSRLTEIYVKRVGPTRPQPDPIQSDYPVADCQQDAWQIIQAIKAAVMRFRETGSEWEFIANPNSMMCAPDYCPAFGTSFCKSHKPRTEE